MLQEIKIKSKLIGNKKPVFIIAEVGINHNGSYQIAKKLVDVAKQAGADCVKFQMRNLKELYSKDEKFQKKLYGV